LLAQVVALELAVVVAAVVAVVAQSCPAERL